MNIQNISLQKRPMLPRKMSTLEFAVLSKECEDVAQPLGGRKTKIVCTIGPSSKSVEMLCDLLKSGMNVARLNFSHGTHDYHAETIQNIRKASEMTCLPCAILLDTKGPEIRTGLLENEKPIILNKGQSIRIHCGKTSDFKGNVSDISVDYKNMVRVLNPGAIIKIDDGLIAIKVDKISGDIITGTVLNTQELGQQKGVNLPGIETGLPTLTEKDISDLRFGVEKQVDIVAASFINSADDIKKIRKVLGNDGAYIKVISKIESVKGLLNFDSILSVSDGIMVARGDLGVEIPIQKVCMAQKTMISKCNAVGKPVVTATQMLDSMIKNPRPTRAEATDVANAVFDGTDCVMLSGETAKGEYPRESVSIMARICRASELSLDHHTLFLNIVAISPKADSNDNLRTEAITSAAVKTAIDLNVSLIFALTDSGRTASFVSKYRPPVPIITVTPNEVTARQALICSGSWPILVDQSLNDAQRLNVAIDLAKKNGWCHSGDCITVVSGKQGVSGSSHLHRVLDVE